MSLEGGGGGGGRGEVWTSDRSDMALGWQEERITSSRTWKE